MEAAQAQKPVSNQREIYSQTFLSPKPASPLAKCQCRYTVSWVGVSMKLSNKLKTFEMRSRFPSMVYKAICSVTSPWLPLDCHLLFASPPALRILSPVLKKCTLLCLQFSRCATPLISVSLHLLLFGPGHLLVNLNWLNSRLDFKAQLRS